MLICTTTLSNCTNNDAATDKAEAKAISQFQRLTLDFAFRLVSQFHRVKFDSKLIFCCVTGVFLHHQVYEQNMVQICISKYNKYKEISLKTTGIIEVGL